MARRTLLLEWWRMELGHTYTKTMDWGTPRQLLTYLSFLYAKELLEPMWPFAAALQGHLVEVYWKWNRKSSFERLYEKVLTLSELVGPTEQRPCICSRQRNWDNTPNRFSGTVLEAANNGITFTGHNFRRTEISLQQTKVGPLRTLCSHSYCNRHEVQRSHGWNW